MTVTDWHQAALDLRRAGLGALADFYAQNARLVSLGERPVWPIPDALRMSARLGGSMPAPFVDDGREP